MKIAIVGAGIVGVTTAYELAADGHAVTVFDRHNAAATQDSFATGGLLAPAAAIQSPQAINSWPNATLGRGIGSGNPRRVSGVSRKKGNST